MSTDQHDEGPHTPQRLNLPHLFFLLQKRLGDTHLHILRTGPTEQGTELYYCEEAFKLWAKDVGAYKGMMESLEAAGGDLCAEMSDDLFHLHQAFDHIEVMVGSRLTTSDQSSRPRSDAFNHFLRLLYTLSPKARKFSGFQSRTRSQSPPKPPNQASTGPRSMTSASIAQSIPPPALAEINTEMTGVDITNQSHLRKDSHMHIKEEESHSGSSSQIKVEEWHAGSSQQVKTEEPHTDILGQIDPWPSSSYESPHLTSQRPAQLSPNTPSSVTEPPFSPITPRSSFPYATSSTDPSEERKRWQQTVLNNDEPTVVMPALMPHDPPFPAIQLQNQLPRIPDLDRPPAQRLSPFSTSPS